MMLDKTRTATRANDESTPELDLERPVCVPEMNSKRYSFITYCQNKK